MRVTRIGWDYNDTVGSIDRNNQGAAGEAVAWAYLNSDRESCILRLWLRLSTNSGAGGVVFLDYPLPDFEDGNALRSTRDKREQFNRALSERVPMSYREAREWFVQFVEPFLESIPPMDEVLRSMERPAPPNPRRFMQGLMENNHPLNALEQADITDQDLNRIGTGMIRQVSDDLLFQRLVEEIDEYTDRQVNEFERAEYDEGLFVYDDARAGLADMFRNVPGAEGVLPLNAPDVIVETPGNPDITEDIPPAPELPEDHPLNSRNDGWHITHIRSEPADGQDRRRATRWNHYYATIAPGDADGLGLLVGEHVFVGNEEMPNGVVQNVQPRPDGTFIINFMISVDYEHSPLGAHFRAVATETGGRPELWIQPLIAEPQRHWIFKVTCLDPFLVSNVAVCAHPNNGHMVIGLFFVPPADDFGEEWHDRMIAWSTWSWGREGADLVINAPDETRSRQPGNYIPNLLAALLNRDLEGWNVVRAPQIPCWLPSGHRYEVS